MDDTDLPADWREQDSLRGFEAAWAALRERAKQKAGEDLDAGMTKTDE